MRVFVVFKWIVGIALLGVSFMVSGIIPLPPGDPGPPSDARPSIDAGSPANAGLSACPFMRAGQVDPIGKKKCVHMLQRRLRDSGYPDQPVNGRFGPLTKANVMAFQKASGLQPDGEVGPQTLAALTGGSTPTRLDLGRPYCPNKVCHFVVPQGAAHRVGTWLANHPERAVDVSIGLLARGVCGAARITAIAKFGCENLVEKEISDFIATLKSAARDNLCVRISVGLPGGGNSEFLKFTSVKCQN
ncbi:peptidoglycan-binding domain-containing protein [Streptosporangium sp. NBC_01469]|uniref:peptidoglycan-binding domain-containing protein n=1 Tax=Streptosporangium sp. NBC_01469 TaxID=2903898 RepID=UPI002E28884D|nr:peptidoglycan-binding domain-containing protein [Streptosporangium sp. NBC_01469]